MSDVQLVRKLCTYTTIALIKVYMCAMETFLALYKYIAIKIMLN